MKILIVGGYGTFGGRIVELLESESTLMLIVAGRSLASAKAFCAGRGKTAANVAAARFDRDGERVRDHAFIPFGGGLRICIGQHLAMAEMQLVLTHLLRSYEWSLVPGQDLTYRRMPTPLPKSGGILHFRARKPD